MSFSNGARRLIGSAVAGFNAEVQLGGEAGQHAACVPDLHGNGHPVHQSSADFVFQVCVAAGKIIDTVITGAVIQGVNGKVAAQGIVFDGAVYVVPDDHAAVVLTAVFTVVVILLTVVLARKLQLRSGHGQNGHAAA